MRTLLFLIPLLTLLISCSQDIEKIANEWCECKEKEFFQGKVQGEQCFEEWNKKYQDVEVTADQRPVWDKITLECRKQYDNKSKQASVQDAAFAYCECLQINPVIDSLEADFCFKNWSQKFASVEMKLADKEKFESIITECAGLNDTLTLDENITLQYIADQYCECVAYSQSGDTIRGLGCFESFNQQYQNLALTASEQDSLSKLLENCINIPD